MLETLSKILNKTKETIFDVLFPKLCINCGKEGSYICEDCSIFMTEASLICPICNKSSFMGQRHQHCSSRLGLSGLVSAWEYEGLVKQMLNDIKYKSVEHIIPECTEKAFKMILSDISRFRPFLSFLLSKDTNITYVPMYRKKEKKRGFNQAKLIAKEVGKISDKPVFPFLKKIKKTQAQAGLDMDARAGNLKNVFEYCGNFTPENIVLVDDIWTTGATMKECCKVLKKAGAQKIWGFTLARPVFLKQ